MAMTCISGFNTFDDLDKQKILSLIKNGLQLDEQLYNSVLKKNVAHLTAPACEHY